VGQVKAGGPTDSVGWQHQRLMGPAARGPPNGLGFLLTNKKKTNENRFIYYHFKMRCHLIAVALDTAPFPILLSFINSHL
jgi:hypothetical protein